MTFFDDTLAALFQDNLSAAAAKGIGTGIHRIFEYPPNQPRRCLDKINVSFADPPW